MHQVDNQSNVIF